MLRDQMKWTKIQLITLCNKLLTQLTNHCNSYNSCNEKPTSEFDSIIENQVNSPKRSRLEITICWSWKKSEYRNHQGIFNIVFHQAKRKRKEHKYCISGGFRKKRHGTVAESWNIICIFHRSHIEERNSKWWNRTAKNEYLDNMD